MKEIHVFLWKATVVHHTDPLLKNEASSGISFDEGLVSHIESATELQNGDLDWEVKRCNATNWAVWHSIACVELTRVVSRLSYGVR